MTNHLITLTPNKYIKHTIYIYNVLQEITALTKRLYLQVIRRPSTVIAGIVQPLLWLILFAALFQNVPSALFIDNIKYTEFLSPGIIIFTAFTGSINAGLPIVFDREFGFLNRILVSPLGNYFSIIISSIISIWTITIGQIIIITICNIVFLNNTYTICYLQHSIVLATLIIGNIASISIGLAFIIPGHIELLAIILITNLPILFSSTALAPLQFMPYWLQILTCLNPLTYAIEILRYIYLNNSINYSQHIMQTLWINLHVYDSINILCLINLVTYMIVKKIIKYKYE